MYKVKSGWPSGPAAACLPCSAGSSAPTPGTNASIIATALDAPAERQNDLSNRAMTSSSTHKAPAASAPSSSPSSSGVQAGGLSPASPIGTLIPISTAAPCCRRGMRRAIQAASSTAATIAHCRRWAKRRS